MKNIFDQLLDLLKKDERLVSQDGVLLKNQTQELARKNDPDLIKLLLSEKIIKQHFFFEVEKTLIFDKEKFIRFISNKQFLPDSYTAFKNKIGLTAGDEYLSESKEVVLAWPYKDCILEGGMTKEDQKRDEIFWNETLAPDEISRLLDPKVFTNAKRTDAKGEHKFNEFKTDENGNIKDNLIIKGNNLLVLHSLKERFAGKIKLIYIDPPYNIGGNGFGYNDQFNESAWLTFIKNRLQIARDLLTEDGTIIIQIDDNEFAQLKLLTDEIFKKAPSGKDNFVQVIELKTNVGAANEYVNPFMPKNCEYLLIYTKNYDKRGYKPEWIRSEVDRNYKYFVENPEDRCSEWKIKNVKDLFVEEYSLEDWDNEELVYQYYFKNINKIFRTISPKGPGKKLEEVLSKSKNNKIVEYTREDGERVVCYKGELVRFYSKNLKEDIDGNLIISRELGSLWIDIPWTGIANEGGVKLKNGKKPEKLLRRIIEMSTEPSELVLDFFMGSGTTAAVAHKTGRQYIGIEQLDYEENDGVARLKNVINGDQTGISKIVGWKGGGDFVYLELMKWNENFVQEIKKTKTKEELKKFWKIMEEKAFLSYKISPETIDTSADDFAYLSIEDQKDFLLKCLDKNHLYVNYSEIADEEYKVSEGGKKINKEFYENK